MVPLSVPVQVNSTLVILTVLLQVTVLLVVALLVSYRYKNNAAIRYGVGYSALVCVAVLSVLSLFVQYNDRSLVSLPLLSEQWLQQSDFSEPFVFPVGSLASAQEQQQLNTIPNNQIAALSGSVSNQFSSVTRVLGLTPKYLVFSALWLGGVLFLVVRLILSFHVMDKVRRGSSCLERNDLEHIACLFGREKIEEFGVQFRESSKIKTPLVVGIFKPIVLLPTRFLWKLNNAQLQAILLHELAHIERQDTKANLLQKLIVALFWFHPLIHLLDRQISRAREELCDNCVLEKQSALEYGEALFHASLATTEVPGKVKYIPGSLGIFNGDWKLEQRIRELIDIEREKDTNLQLEDKIGIFLSVGMITLALSFSKISTAQMTIPLTGTAVPVSESIAVDPKTIRPIRINYIPNIDSSPRLASPAYQESTTDERSNVMADDLIIALSNFRHSLYSDQAELDPVEAKEIVDRLYEERFSGMNDFEKSTMLILYAEYYMGTSNYPEAIRVFEQILNIENLRETVRLRSLRALGLLNHSEENHSDAIRYFSQWRELSDIEDETVLHELASSFAAQGDYREAYYALIDLQSFKNSQIGN